MIEIFISAPAHLGGAVLKFGGPSAPMVPTLMIYTSSFPLLSVFDIRSGRLVSTLTGHKVRERKRERERERERTFIPLCIIHLRVVCSACNLTTTRSFPARGIPLS